ncbi:PPC domain-containing protein [Pseudoalteromonas denitrificans]|nr:PPC domain-containing protein [Pseudoalteromonas denitrificans]
MNLFKINILKLALIGLLSSAAFTATANNGENTEDININAPIDLERYKYIALVDSRNIRCVGGVTDLRAYGELTYGLNQNLFTRAAYDWGKENYYYPVIDRNNRLNAVCKSSDFTPVSGDINSDLRFKIFIPSGIQSLKVELSGNNGDADLYIKQGTQPLPFLNDCASENIGSNDSCQVNNPTAGTWHILVHGYSKFSDVKLKVKF